MGMKKIAFLDTKPYDRESFDRLNNGRYEIRYFETRLTAAALLAALRDRTVGGAAQSNCPRRTKGRCH